MTSLTQEKQELEMLASSLKLKLSSDKYHMEQAQKKVMNLETALEEKECQFTSYYNALEVRKGLLQVQFCFCWSTKRLFSDTAGLNFKLFL